MTDPRAETVVRVTFKNVEYKYRRGQSSAISGIDWDIPRPGVYGLLGPNGAGKTTLIRLLATSLRPSGGSIEVSGGPLSDSKVRTSFRESLGYLPQEFRAWPGFSASECVAYVAWLRGCDLREDCAGAALRALEAVGMNGLGRRQLRHMSSGERRRVGIAQAIVNSPSVLLLDEPTAGLDPAQRLQFRQLVRARAEKSIVILSTHLVEDVATACDEVAIMDRGQWRFQGTPEALRDRGRSRVDADASDFERGYLGVLDE